MQNTKLLFISDLDGTLLNRESKVNDAGAKLINELITNENFILTFATARDFVSVKKVLSNIKLRHPIITANGAFIVNPQNEELIYGSYFNDDEKKELDGYFKNYNVHPIVYANYENRHPSVSWEELKETDGMLHYLHQRANDPRLRPLRREERERLMEGKVYCINLMDSKENLIPLYDFLSKEKKFYIIFHQELYREEWWLSIYPKTTNKGRTAKKLKELLGAEKLIVFGDRTNDLPLFDVADEAYAVENASPELKKVATKTIGKNTDNSVPNWIKVNWKKL